MAPEQTAPARVRMEAGRFGGWRERGKHTQMRRLPLVGQGPDRWHGQKSKSFLEGKRLKDAGASRWSAVNGIGDTTKKQLGLDRRRPSHGSRDQRLHHAISA